MARRKKGRPKKAKQVTYDSKETRFLIAVVAFAVSVLGLFSYIISDTDNFLGFIKLFFGDATFFLSVFLLNLSLRLFGAKYALSSNKSLISQLLITGLFAIFLSAMAAPIRLREISYAGGMGGVFGYELANFSANNFLLDLTGVAAVVGMIILLPSTFNQSIAEFFSAVFKSVTDMLAGIFARPPVDPQPAQLQQQPESAANTMPAMFSDFRSGKNASANSQPLKAGNPGFAGASNMASSNHAGNASHAGNTSATNSAQAAPSQPAMSAQSGVPATQAADIHAEGLKFPKWQLPPLDLLDKVPPIEKPKEDVESNSLIIEQTLKSFGIESKVVNVMVGPSVTQYALDIALGIKVSKIANLRNDLALALATSANSVRIEVPIPGTSYVGIEIPNSVRTPVFFREIMQDQAMANPKNILPVSVGKGIAGNVVVGDIQKMPHLLIAGATGSGKSVLTVSFILSLLMKLTPDEVKFIMVDPKQVELSDFNDIPHLISPVIVDMAEVLNALKWAVAEMEKRYTIFRESKVRNIEGYNQAQGYAALPYIVIVIDELADMMLTAGKVDIETNIVRLAQKARATGIHLILATQRPSVNVITGIIKANIPGRIGMSVTTGVDSRVIIDTQGAEALLGKGDLLFKEPDKNKPFRVQGVFVKQEEVQRVVGYIKEQAGGQTYYIEDVTAEKEDPNAVGGGGMNLSGDDMFADAVRVIVSTQKGSASMIQRRLSLGYNRAAKLIDEMEEMGIVGPPNGSKPREVMITDAEAFLQQLRGE
jgi:S-DNA-T family DNA segregation ATPase FtsK/SpoIIIE